MVKKFWKADNKKAGLVVVILIIVVAVLVIQNPFQREEGAVGELRNNENTGLDVGNQAPDFVLENMKGEEMQLSNFRNEKAVVVNFWASWCPPCRDEMPAFQQVFENSKDDVVILGVNLQEKKSAIKGFLQEIPITYPLLLDPNSKVKGKYGVFTQPVTYFIDKEGIIVDKKFGPLTEKEIEGKFAKLGVEEDI